MKKLIYTLLILAFVSSVSAQWSEQNSGVNTPLSSVSAVDNNIVWICGEGGKVLRTTNGGTNWEVKTSPLAAVYLHNIWGRSADTAYVTANSSTAYVYRTTNGGVSWAQVFSQVGGFVNAIYGLSLNDPNALMIFGDPVGGRYSIWVSQPGGLWDSSGMYIPQITNETGIDNSVFVLRGPQAITKIWFGTNNTKIYKWSFTQGWTTQITPGQSEITSIVFADSLKGLAGGTFGGILFTSNGGQNWIPANNTPGSGYLTGVAYGNSTEVYYCRGGEIYKTTNGGQNWIVQWTSLSGYNHMSKARAGNNIWAVTGNGGISKYTASVGINPISTEIPSSYSLGQNYPNPFNPKTVISFQLTVVSNVVLKVYDVMGREVTTLVNERLQAGTYSVDWNAYSFPSGVYFYRITTEKFSAVKKMMLVK